MKKADSQLIGIAGENFVAGELLKNGFIATITGKNTKSVDILCMNPGNFKLSAIQVKTTTTIKNEKGTWMLDAKDENLVNDSLYYVFISIEGNQNRFFVIPSKTLSDEITKKHKKWLQDKNRKHHDNSIRTVDYNFVQQFENNWFLLK